MKHKHEYPKRWGRVILILVIALIVVGGGLGYYLTQPQVRSSARASSSSSSQTRVSTVVKPSSSTASPRQQPSQKEQLNQQKQKPNPSNAEIARQYLLGKGFQMVPVAFDGEDPTTAMDEGKARPNLMHDGALIFYFKDNSTIRATGLGSYAGAFSGSYTLTNNMLSFSTGNRNVPYKITNGAVQFDQWTETFEGHIITKELKPDSTAKTYVDGKAIQ